MWRDTPGPQRTEALAVAIQRHLPHFDLNIDFCVSAGRTALFGPSGAGKSLTLQAMAGLFPLDRARISNGQIIWHESDAGIFVPPQQRRVGYLPQNYALFPHLTVVQNIAFGQRQRGIAARKRVGELIVLMQLEGLERQRPAQLSGGQQQRVALARALASDPQLLLLDEPWSALDASVRATLRAEIQRFYEQVQVPLVLVTHDVQDAQALADTIVVIDHGRVLQIGSPEEIFRAPRTPRIADLVGMKTRWNGTIVALESDATATGRLATIEVVDLTLHAFVAPESKLRVGHKVEIGVCADEISLHAPDTARIECGSAEQAETTSVRVAGTVMREPVYSSFSSVTMQIASHLQLDVPIPRWQQRTLRIAAGMPLPLCIPCEALHIFDPTEMLADNSVSTISGPQATEQIKHAQGQQAEAR
jgi:molybdate transport system ATP-binding protein